MSVLTSAFDIWFSDITAGVYIVIGISLTNISSKKKRLINSHWVKQVCRNALLLCNKTRDHNCKTLNLHMSFWTGTVYKSYVGFQLH